MTRVDHVLVAVGDLTSSVATWKQAGLSPQIGGTHPGGTSNALVRGPERAYLELICAGAGGDETTARVRDSTGPISWALGVDDIDAARRRLVGAGYSPGPVRAGSRTTPAGDELRWRLCDIADGPLHPVVPFLIQWDVPMPAGPAHGPRLRSIVLETPTPARTAQVLAACGLLVVSKAVGAPIVTDGYVTIALCAGPGGVREVGMETAGVPRGDLVLDGLTLRCAAGPAVT